MLQFSCTALQMIPRPEMTPSENEGIASSLYWLCSIYEIENMDRVLLELLKHV